jgi:antitoxin FitA
VRDLEEGVKCRERRAAHHCRSMEDEVRDILRDAAENENHRAEALGTRRPRRFSSRGRDFDIPEIHGAPGSPASLEEKDLLDADVVSVMGRRNRTRNLVLARSSCVQTDWRDNDDDNRGPLWQALSERRRRQAASSRF